MSITSFSPPTAIQVGADVRQRDAAQPPRLAALATADICHQTKPRPCPAADFKNLFEAAP